jgi:CDP-glycerol glycerophosphotransferase (TagB/SpsB family)
MKINFIRPKSSYSGVLNSFIKPIIKHLPDSYEINNKKLPDCLNVYFFLEQDCSGGVFISHGIADKNWRNASSTNKFDHVFVSGESWKEKLINQGMNKDKIHIVGYTKLDPIFNNEIKRKKSNNIRILFAPTHKAVPKVSLDGKFDEYLKELSKTYEIIDSRHPAIQKDNNMPTLQGLVDCDIVISDCSSLLYEGLILGKPVVMADWLVKEGILEAFPNSFESLVYNGFIFENKEFDIGLHAESFEHMLKILKKVKNYKFNFMEKSLVNGILPEDLQGNSGKVTAKKLLELARR